jgi:hypothetical protein
MYSPLSSSAAAVKNEHRGKPCADLPATSSKQSVFHQFCAYFDPYIESCAVGNVCASDFAIIGTYSNVIRIRTTLPQRKTKVRKAHLSTFKATMSDTDSLLQFPTAAPDAAAGESSDSMTFGMLGILLFLDTCFVANYYIVRSLRRCTDAHAKTLPAEKDFGNSAKASPAGAFVEKFIFGLLMGKVKPIPLSIQKFPEWKPIKYKAQVFLTGFFVLISLAILNPDAFAGDADVGGLTLDAEFCKPFDRQNGLDELRQEVFTVTNYNDSVLQWRHMWFFQQALLNDTSRYGEDAFSCVDTAEVTKTTHADGSTTEVENKFISGKKKNWVDITEFPAVEFG